MRLTIVLLAALLAVSTSSACSDSKDTSPAPTAPSGKSGQIPEYDQIEKVFVDARFVCNRSGIYSGPRDAIISVLQEKILSAQDGAETDPALLETVRVDNAIIDAAHTVPPDGVLARVRCHLPDSSGAPGDIWTFATGGPEKVFLVQVNDDFAALSRLRAAGARLDVSHYRD